MDSLFAIPDGVHRGLPASKATIARSIRTAILEAYRVKHRGPPPEMKAHSTPGSRRFQCGTSQGFRRRLCKTATWSSIHTFRRTTADSSLGRRILQAAVWQQHTPMVPVSPNEGSEKQILRIIPDVDDLKIKREKISRQDVNFMKKHGQQLYRHIYLGCKEEDNVQKNYELLYTALSLVTIELANEEVVIDLIRVAIALQDLAITNEDNLPMFSRCSIMALVAAYLNFLSQMIAVPAFCQHVSKVIETRNMEAPYFLPEVLFRDKCSLPKSLDKHDKNVFFLTNKIVESLGGSGYGVERLSVPYVPQVTGRYNHNN
ncbi:unnamed protein product [Ranitomeya imitator]|uniref:Uncharacterized protein n=1 Tax=Ranitomeya imitator TaxID=111125 RepID=A0ABN9LHM7_9NEOB|nr:unnamed protein product [Ranitomeya imitator]